MAIVQEGSQDASGVKRKHGVDAAQAFGPGPAQEFVQHRLRLVVQGMRSRNCVHQSVHHQLPEERIAKVAGCLLQSFMEVSGGGGCIGAMQVKRKIVGLGQAANKRGVFFGGFAYAVMDVNHGKYDPQFRPLFQHAPQQSHGVGAARDCDCDPLPGTKETGTESKPGRLHDFGYVSANIQRTGLKVKNAGPLARTSGVKEGV